MSFLEVFTPTFKVDGEDHIRISVRGETLVGRMSAHDYKYEFFIPHLGHFLSPICFANWLATGDEEARHNPDFKVKTSIKGYRKYVLYAKFWQLCKMRPRLLNEKMDVPFVSYRIHQTGIKELNRWKEYSPTVKSMLEHIVDPKRGPQAPFKWPKGLVREVEDIVTKIAEKQGYVPPENGEPTIEEDKETLGSSRPEESEKETVTSPIDSKDKETI